MADDGANYDDVIPSLDNNDVILGPVPTSADELDAQQYIQQNYGVSYANPPAAPDYQSSPQAPQTLQNGLTNGWVGDNDTTYTPPSMTPTWAPTEYGNPSTSSPYWNPQAPATQLAPSVTQLPRSYDPNDPFEAYQAQWLKDYGAGHPYRRVQPTQADIQAASAPVNAVGSSPLSADEAAAQQYMQQKYGVSY